MHEQKKGQIEIMGLMVVVILIIVGGLFYIKYGVLGGKKEATDSSIEQAYSIGLLNALLNVKVCEEAQIRVGDGLVKCYEGGQEICSQEACEYLKGQMKDIIGSVGLKNYKSYSFWIEKSGEPKNLFEDCKTGVKTDEVIIADNNEEYTVNFRIC